MNKSSRIHAARRRLAAGFWAALALLAWPGAQAATVDVSAEADVILLSQAELADVVGPVALYPDDLLAIVLPASTYPLQVVQAARFLDALEDDPSLRPDPEWDDAIVALLNYPEVLRLMNDDLDWTWSLGDAVINQQPDVLAAIEEFRDQAYKAGNLESDEHQNVVVEEEVIRITPVEREVIYVPYYEPSRVVVYQREPVYFYYPRRYPVYYYPYRARHSFANGFFWGVSTAYRIGWGTRHVHLHYHNYRSHPYWGRSYLTSYYYHHRYRPWRDSHYRRHAHSRGYQPAPHVNRFRDRDYRGDEWRPGRRHGVRQQAVERRVERRVERQLRETRRAYREGRRDGVREQRQRTQRAVRAGGARQAPRHTAGSTQRTEQRAVRGERRDARAVERRDVRTGRATARREQRETRAVARTDQRERGVTRRTTTRDTRTVTRTHTTRRVQAGGGSSARQTARQSTREVTRPTRTVRQAPQRRTASAPRSSTERSRPARRAAATNEAPRQRPARAASRNERKAAAAKPSQREARSRSVTRDKGGKARSQSKRGDRARRSER